MDKFAFLINAKTDEPGPTANNLGYANRLDEAGHEVVVFFDGQGTHWIPKLEEETDHVVHGFYQEARDRGLVTGACGFCSAYFEIDDEIEAAGIALDGGLEEGEHGPDVPQLVEDGYDLINVG